LATDERTDGQQRRFKPQARRLIENDVNEQLRAAAHRTQCSHFRIRPSFLP